MDLECEMTKRAPLISAAITAALAGIVSAGPIGINYVDIGDPGVQNATADALLATESAGAPGYVQSGWNNMGRWGQTVPINDSTGAPTGATSTWDSNNTWNDGAGVSSPNAKLMNGYLDATGQPNNNTSPGYAFFDNVNKPEVYITGLTSWLTAQGAASYKVVVYTDGDSTSGRKAEYWLQSATVGDPPTVLGADLTSHVFVSDVSNFSGTFTEVPLSANTLATAGEGNFFVFTGVSADSFILRSEEWPGVAGDALRAQINGIQIIASVPEPASIGLLALAGLGLLSRRRRR